MLCISSTKSGRNTEFWFRNIVVSNISLQDFEFMASTPEKTPEELGLCDSRLQSIDKIMKCITPEDHPDGPDQRIEHHFSKDHTLRQISLVRNGAKGKYGDGDTYPSDRELLKEVQMYYPNAKYEPTRGNDGVRIVINTHDNSNKKMHASFGHKNREWHFCATLEGFKSGFMPHVSWPS